MSHISVSLIKSLKIFWPFKLFSNLYLEYHYSIKVNLAYPSQAEPFVYGTMRISLYGTSGQLIDATIAEYDNKIV